MDSNLFELLKKLIELDSTTGKERPIAEWVGRHLEERGFEVTRQPVNGERFNLVARFGDPIVVFSSHLDTVPEFVPFSEDERFVYGRGACDAKGIVAAQIQAGERLVREGIRNIGFLFLVGEEYGSDGARMANAFPNRCQYLIGGEPTQNRLALASKGAFRIVLEFGGRSAHSACPEQGDSAVTKLLDALQRLRQLSFPAHPVLGDTTLNIGVLSGGERANVVPCKAVAEILFRTSIDTNAVKEAVFQAAGPDARISVAFESDPAFFEPVDGFETTVVPFTTDLPLLDRWGKKLLIGPGSILDAHVPTEKVEKTELEKGVHTYCRLVKSLVSRRGIET